MVINVLFFGDIVGSPGREAVAEFLPELQEKYQPDLILANADNVTHGRGFSRAHYDELRKLGIDGFSGGDHIWRDRDFMAELDKPDVLVARPANFHDVPGRGYVDFVVKGKKVWLVHLMGRVFTTPQLDSPFHVYDALEKELPAADITLVDFHAEATSEKRILAEHLDGRASLVVGTHTHVPTADAQILPKGCGFISDIGMCGPQDSSLGADKEPVLKSFLTGLPWTYSVSEGQCELGAVFCTIDVDSRAATHIEHIRHFTRL